VPEGEVKFAEAAFRADSASFSTYYHGLATAYHAATEPLGKRTEFAQDTANSLGLTAILQINSFRHAVIAETTTSTAEQQIGRQIRLVH
jgi:hypothetical protein